MASPLDFISNITSIISNVGSSGFSGLGATVAEKTPVVKIRNATLERIDDTVEKISASKTIGSFFSGTGEKKVATTSDPTFVTKTVDFFRPAVSDSLQIAKESVRDLATSGVKSLFDKAFKRDTPTTHEAGNFVPPTATSGIAGFGQASNIGFVTDLVSKLASSKLPTTSSPTPVNVVSVPDSNGVSGLLPVAFIGIAIFLLARGR